MSVPQIILLVFCAGIVPVKFSGLFVIQHGKLMTALPRLEQSGTVLPSSDRLSGSFDSPVTTSDQHMDAAWMIPSNKHARPHKGRVLHQQSPASSDKDHDVSCSTQANSPSAKGYLHVPKRELLAGSQVMCHTAGTHFL
jgi:hypothetical protein